MADPARVHWELIETDYGSCRLAVHHAQGVTIEYYRTVPMALRRIQELEQVLIAAMGGQRSPAVS